MDIRNSQTDQYNQNHNDSSTSLAPEQSNNRNCENMYLQHDCAASFHPIVNATNSSCEMIPPSMNNNYTYNILQSESSTAAIHSYNHPLYENNDQERSTTTTLICPSMTNNESFSNYLTFDQQPVLPVSTMPLPNFHSSFTQELWNTSLVNEYISNFEMENTKFDDIHSHDDVQ
ncbi:hypothetical protein I4U23_012265 [Adineta vaga]|nr:hypothetical protein I4U23_012265 [Adineta vaga]